MNSSVRIDLLIAALVALCAATLHADPRDAVGTPGSDHMPSAGTATPARADNDALTSVHATARKQRVGDVHYALDYTFDAHAEAFEGAATIRFDLRAADEALTVDFGGGSVLEATLNGATLNGATPNVEYNGAFLTLPASALRTGANQLDVLFSHPYSKDGTGLHRFVDPEDGRTYLYTYLWPYYANRLFPCFDQPNLKATFDLRVRAPRSWTVVSMAAGRRTQSDGDTSTWTFETTPKISTYVFSLHAGPYQVWSAQAGEVAIRLMARQSLSRYVAVDEWFDLTRRGLDYFGAYFEIPYPFGKYDQLIVPDFAIGAMENVAAVTFSERFVQRQASSRFERESRASVILHEMAHMWFGNLVTKDWWNGLWLNESFATLMGHLALVEATEFTDAWHDFYVDNKQRAYVRDSRVTTHPIEVPVPSTDDFFSVFDAITYQKGSSVLKQLAHFVGPENFRKGVAHYLQEHAYGNTHLDDFIGSLARRSGRDLEEWARLWLYEPGYNALQTRVECDDGRIDRLVVEQTSAAGPTPLRSHRVELALYDERPSGGLQLREVLDVEIAGSETEVKQAAGTSCPALVFANHADWAFARVELDEQAVAVIRANLGRVEDPLTRSMFLQSLFDMAKAGDLALEEYVSLALDASRSEHNLRVLAQLTLSIAEAVGTLERLAPESLEVLQRLRPGLEDHAWQRVRQERDPDAARLWFDLFVAVADSEDARSRLSALLVGDTAVLAVPIEQDIRWNLVVALSAKGEPGSAARITQEKSRDASDFGEKMAIAADASWPAAETKDRWFAKIADPASELGLARQRFAIAALYPSTQTALQLRKLDEILASLPELSATRDPYFLSSFTEMLLKPMGRPESVAAFERALEKADVLDSTTRRFLREAHQADRELLKLRRSLR